MVGYNKNDNAKLTTQKQKTNKQTLFSLEKFS